MAALFVPADTATALALDSARRQAKPGLVRADAPRVELRRVQPADATLLAGFVAQLSPLSRRRRFHSGVRELPPAWLDHLLHPDPTAEYALLALASAGGAIECVGEARYARSEDENDAREFALAVADRWQSQGVGSNLLRMLVCHARAQGLARLYGDVMRENLPMLGLAQRLGFSSQRHPSDATLVRVERELGQVFAEGAGWAPRVAAGASLTH